VVSSLVLASLMCVEVVELLMKQLIDVLIELVSRGGGVCGLIISHNSLKIFLSMIVAVVKCFKWFI
jgi:hypothetical protein